MMKKFKYLNTPFLDATDETGEKVEVFASM